MRSKMKVALVGGVAAAMVGAVGVASSQTAGTKPSSEGVVTDAITGKPLENTRYQVVCAEGMAWIIFYKRSASSDAGVQLFTPQPLPNSQYCKK